MPNLVTRTVSIGPEDIAAGRPCESSSCPAAIAISRAFPELNSVHVTASDIQTFIGSDTDADHRITESPPALTSFVWRFDNADRTEKPTLMQRLKGLGVPNIKVAPLPEPVAFDLTLEINEHR